MDASPDLFVRVLDFLVRIDLDRIEFRFELVLGLDDAGDIRLSVGLSAVFEVRPDMIQSLTTFVRLSTLNFVRSFSVLRTKSR